MNRTGVINFLIGLRGYKRYLEIGVRDIRHNFNLIDCPYKEGVDPKPVGEIKWKMTSDEFFKKIDQSVKYDIIFVDGMHTYEAASKDITNSLSHLSQGGTVILHDCNPPTRYAQRSYKSYKRTKGKWNGTVWLAYVTLRVTRPDLFMYVVDTDEGVGVISKGRQVLAEAKVPMKFETFAARRKELLNLVSIETFRKMEKGR